MDRETKNRLQRERRLKSNNVETKRYEKTINGFLMRLYRNMKSRISGVQKEKYHLYEGKELLSKDEFYEWAKSNDTFLVLFDEYKKNEYDRRLAPSVDRIDSSKGYELSNMEFVTHSENSRRGSLSKLRCNGKNRPPSAL
jgi:hypothetical protein